MIAADSAPAEVAAVIRLQHAYWSRRGEPFNLVKKLQGAKCPDFAEYVGSRLQKIL